MIIHLRPNVPDPAVPQSVNRKDALLWRFREIARSCYYLCHFCLFVCLSVENNSVAIGPILMKSDNECFSKICRKIQVSLKSDTNSASFERVTELRRGTIEFVCLPVRPSFRLSVGLSVRPSVCLSARLFVCLSVRLSVCLSVCPPFRPSVCLPSVCLSVRLSVCPSVCLSVRPSVCLPVCPSVCPSVRLSVRSSVCLSARLSAWNSYVPAGQIFMKFGFEYFSKMLRVNPSLINIGQEQRVHMKTNVHLLSYLAQLFLW